MALAAPKAIEAVWRVEAARLMGGLVRLTRDVGRAEDLAQEALVAALERWPATGIPDNPGAWLMTTAKHLAVDHLRRQQMQARKHQALAAEDAARPGWSWSTRSRRSPPCRATTCCRASEETCW